MKKKKIEDFKKVLVVEGRDDVHFFAEFFKAVGKDDEVFIDAIDGRGNLETKLSTLINKRFLAEKTHVGVLVDADDDGRKVANKLVRLLKQLTEREVDEGEWSTNGLDVKVGFFVAPHPDEIGEIEDLIWRTFSSDPVHETAVRCVEQFITCMNAGPTPQNQRIAKRRLGSLLAVLHEDDPRLGPAARDRQINFSAPELSRLRDFLIGF